MSKCEKHSPAPSLQEVESWLTIRWVRFFGESNLEEDDDFFSLGGHSLLAIRLITQVHGEYKTILSIGDIFNHRTRSSLANLILDRRSIESIQHMETIPEVDRSAPLALSPTQEYILFESVLNSDQPIYNEVATLHLGKIVALEPLKQAFNAIITRHEAFRTAFGWESGELRQEVRPVDPVEIPIKDFRGYSKEEREQQAENFANEWSRGLFDLKQAPLIRAFLGLHSDADTRLYVVAHHLAIDAYTLFDIFPKDLWALYTAFCDGGTPDLPHLEIQSPDVAAWRKFRSLENKSAALSYWKTKLSGFRPLQLQGNRRATEKVEAHGCRRVFHLTANMTKDVKRCAVNSDTTAFVVLLAAFKALLFSETTESDITIGSVTGGREHPQVQHVAGCFLHFVALRTLLSRELTVSELLARVSETVLSAVEHQEIPLLQARDAAEPSSASSKQPVYRIMFLMEPPQEKLPGGWTVNQLEFHPGTAKLDLTFELDEKDGCLFGRVEYRNSKYTDSFIDDLIDGYKDILSDLVQNSQATLEQLGTDAVIPSSFALSDEFRVEYLRNPAIRLYDPMEAIARESPERIALEFGAERMTYGQLKKHSDNIARLLQGEGIGNGEIVAVVARRSLWLQVALFGVIKSGAAYLPIDPDQPGTRVRYLLEDSRAGFALLDPEVALPTDMTVGSHDIRDAALHGGNGALVDTARPHDLAYVLYTSGSTGNPKGAMIEHQSIVNRLQWMVHEYQLSEIDVQIQKTPITFDVSLHELFLWSFIGARLAIPPPGAERDPEELVRLIKCHQVTQIHFVPSMLEVFLAYISAFGKGDALATLKHVHCSGEALPLPTVKAFQDQIGKPMGVQLHNLYGPTEAAVDVSYFDCTNFSGGTSVPIGKAVWNTQLYVLDKNLRPVEEGQAGELYIGGLQVGRGYINHPELTEAAFIPDPFGNEEGARLYKTGDLAQWRADGNLDYLGRNDFQIKIRGVRIEPAEIENAIREFPGIAGAVCVARKNDNGDVQLVGYYVGESRHESPLKKSLTEHLRRCLAPQMVPAILIELDSLPLNASGKLNRKALPNPIIDEQVSASGSTNEETLLIRAWETVLQVKGISLKDDFFELGGDSILAIRVISVIRQEGYQITLRDFFEYSGLKGMAMTMEPLPEETEQQGEAIEKAPVIPVQRWFLGLGLTRPSHWNQSRLIELADSIEPDILEKALLHVILNHHSLQLRFSKEANTWVQALNPDFAQLRMEIVDTSSLGKGGLTARCAEAQASLDIEAGILLRAVYFQNTSNNSRQLFLCIHHLVIDGVSWQIVLEDLESAYDALAANSEPNLPREITSSLEWANILQQHAQTSLSDDDDAYWKSFEEAPSPLIPADRELAGNLVNFVREHTIQLGREETEQLLNEVPARYNTEINDILLSALGMVLRNASGQDRVTFFVEGHGREWIPGVRDLSRTTGWFTTLYPVSLRVGFDDISSLIKSVKEQIRAIPGRGIGFGLKDCFSGQANNSDSIKPELVFNYLGNMDRQLSGLRVLKNAHIPWESETWAGDERPWTHEILAWVKNCQLTIAWYTNSKAFSPEIMNHLGQDLLGHLGEIISHCLTDDAGGYTPSDFESAGLSQDELDDLYSDFSENN